MTMTYLFLFGALILNSSANILLKLGARPEPVGNISLTTLVSQYGLAILGVTLFALNIVLYFLSLRALPLSVAYPVMVIGGFLIVNTFAFFILKEHIGTLQIIGYVLMIAGMLVVVTTSKV